MENENVPIEHEIQPDPERVIEGLRDTGYSFNTAIADILDNSIAANASKIYVRISADPERVLSVSIIDNGIGMDMDGLINAMRYGSKRRNNPDSLGKFGLGLKTASTAFCRSLSLISRSSSDNTCRKIQWDLDYVAQVGRWLTKTMPPSEDELDEFESLLDGSSGTMVLWDKIDRLLSREYKQPKAFKKHLIHIIDSLKDHLSLTFQKFIDPAHTEAPNIDIYVNDELLTPNDPFQLGRVLINQEVEIEINNGEKLSSAVMTLKAYCLPRREEISSKEILDSLDISNELQGFYVYRENRLIHYGGWLGLFKAEPHLSLLRVELTFDHKLDDILHIDIKKSRILMHQGLSDNIMNSLAPARREAEKTYRKGSNKLVNEETKGVHTASNNNIEQKAPKLERSSVTPISKNEVEIENKHGKIQTKFKIRQPVNDGEWRISTVDNIESGLLWQPCLTDGKHGIELNTSHEYYRKIYYPLRHKSAILTGMDALMWALAEAEISNFNKETRRQYEEMRIDVSRILTHLIEDLPDPEE